MLIDILSTANNVCFNSKIAHLVGLKAAIYIAEVLNIYDKATRKNALDAEQYCTLDREYITKRTTLSLKDQMEAEELLKEIEVLNVGEDSSVYLNIGVILDLLAEERDVKLSITPSKKLRRKFPSQGTKRQAIADNLKCYVESENEELKQAYKDWIDAVYANPRGFLSRRSIQIFQQTIESFANHDLDLALKLIEIATVNGLRDATWAIESYKRQFGVSYRLPVQGNTTAVTDQSQLSEVVF